MRRPRSPLSNRLVGPVALARLVWFGLRSSPALFLASFAAVLLAGTVLAAAPLYTRAVSDLGLRRELQLRGPALTSLLAEARLYPIDRDAAARLETGIRGHVEEAAGWFLQQPAGAASARRALLDAARGPAPRDGAPRAVVQLLPGFEAAVRVVDGALPAEQGDGKLHVVLGKRAADAIRAAVGQELFLFPPSGADPPAPVVVDGIVEPLDPENPLWQQTDLWFRAVSESNAPPTLRLLVTEETFFTALPRLLPSLTASYSWYYPIDSAGLDAGRVRQARDAVDRLRDSLPAAVERAGILSGLDSVIDGYLDKRLFSGLPVIALLAQVAGLTLFLAWTAGSALSRKQEQTAAVILGRGAGRGQLFLAQLFVGLAFALPAAAAAPLLAGEAVAGLGAVAPFAAVTGGGRLPVSLSPEIFAVAAAGGLAASLVLALPGAAGLPVNPAELIRRRARPPRLPFIHRHYVDLLVLGAGMLLFYELRQSQGAVSRSIFGDRNADPLLLLAPGVLAAGIALVLLRALPPLARLLARPLLRFGGSAPALVVLRLIRSPAPAARTAGLAVMAGALAALAASFAVSMQESNEARALFATGADLRLRQVSGNRSPDGADLLAAAQAASPDAGLLAVQRAGATAPRASSPLSVTLLGLDGDRATDLVPLRDDFLRGDRRPFFTSVRGNPARQPGIELAGTPRFAGLYLRSDPPQINANAWLRLSDAAGRYFNVLLGSLEHSGWAFLEADLREQIRGFPDTVTFPLRLQAVFFSNLGQATIASGGDVYMDELQVRQDEAAPYELVEPFEGEGSYRLLPVNTVTPDSLETVPGVARSGRASARLHWTANRGNASRYVAFANFNVPVPAAVSDNLAAALGLRPGDHLVLSLGLDTIPLRVVAGFRYFPTLAAGSGAVVVDVRHLSAAARLVDARQAFAPNELWVYGEEVDRAALLSGLREAGIRVQTIDDRREIQDRFAGDPLLAAGTGGLLLLGLGAALAVAVIGLLLFVLELLDERRTEGAVLRALGMRHRELAVSWWAEVVAIVGLGVLAGMAVGSVLADALLSYLAFDESGRPLVPPFRTIIDWRIIGYAAGVLVISTLVTGLVLALAVRRIPVAATLRTPG